MCLFSPKNADLAWFHCRMKTRLLLISLAIILLFSACAAPVQTPTVALESTTALPPPTATLRPSATNPPPTPTDTAIPDTPTPTATFTPIPITLTPTIGIGTVMNSEKDGMTLVYVPSGPFLMGSDVDEVLAECQKYFDGCAREQFSNEEPAHNVTLDAYWIDQTEVTNSMYARCVEDGACRLPYRLRSETRSAYFFDTQYARYPVVFVSWNDAEAYCHWAGRRLPTEAEWEKAARGSDSQIYPWGSQQPTCELANFEDSSGYCVGDTTAVGSFPNGASPYGALDMAGNVEEWVQDFYDPNYYKNSPDNNPPGPSDSGAPDNGVRIARGGSWWDIWINLRSASRYTYQSTGRFEKVGFRCATSAP